MDLGPCPKSHADKYKVQFQEEQEKNPDNKKIAEIQREYENNIFQFVDECEVVQRPWSEIGTRKSTSRVGHAV